MGLHILAIFGLGDQKMLDISEFWLFLHNFFFQWKIKFRWISVEISIGNTPEISTLICPKIWFLTSFFTILSSGSRPRERSALWSVDNARPGFGKPNVSAFQRRVARLHIYHGCWDIPIRRHQPPRPSCFGWSYGSKFSIFFGFYNACRGTLDGFREWIWTITGLLKDPGNVLKRKNGVTLQSSRCQSSHKISYFPQTKSWLKLGIWTFCGNFDIKKNAMLRQFFASKCIQGPSKGPW